jgi:tripartite-type tricarboxylate transporter receptor subunit TctC
MTHAPCPRAAPDATGAPRPAAITPSRRRAATATIALAVGLAGLLPDARAQADAWPSRPVTIVSPYNPGGTNDVPARVFAEGFERLFGQRFIVRNAPGAAGIVGSNQVMHAAPDGYTLLSTNSGAMIVQSVVKTPAPYEPLRDFTPIVKFVDGTSFVGVSGQLPVATVGELIALAKRDPGKLNYSSSGSGSFGNFLGEYFKLLSGTDIVHVPGKGSAAAVMEMKAGRIEVMFDPIVLPQSADGRVKVLAVIARERLESHPQIPTVKESGGPEMVLDAWFGLFGPAGMPPEIVAKLEAAARKVMEDPQVRRRFVELGLVPTLQGSVPFRARIAEEARVYSDIRSRAKLVVE